MTERNPTNNKGRTTRRDFLQTSVAAVTATSLATGLGSQLPKVHAAGSSTIRVGLIGCGGRGSGAAAQAMNAGKDVKLVAMGDMFRDRLESSRSNLKKVGGDNFQVTDDRCFVGFDAYKQVLECGVDAVLLATPPHFRPEHLKAAIAADKHVFAEKPIAVDAPGVRSVLATCEEARRKNLSVVSGLMLHYEPSMQQTVAQVHNGAIGKIVALQCNYNVSGLWVKERQEGWTDMEYQLRNWYYFTWLSGDHIVEQHVHCLDLISWVMQGEYPVRAVGLGGRQARTQPRFGHIFDHHAVCYEYANGVRCFSACRQQDGTAMDISNYAFGSNGTANLMNRTITGGNPWTYGGSAEDIRRRGHWGGHQEEQTAMFAALRSGKTINDGQYMAKSTLMAIMGRMATYTGQVIQWDQAFNSSEDLTPSAYEFGPLPMPPVAIPGVTKFA